MTIASTSERLSCGASALIFGVVTVYSTYSLYRNITHLKNMILVHADGCSDKRWLTTARICAIIGSCIVVPYWAFHVGLDAVIAFSGTLVHPSPIVLNHFATLRVIGWGFLVFAGLMYFFHPHHGSERCALPDDGQRSNAHTLHSQPPRREPPKQPEGYRPFSGQGYRLGGQNQ